MKMDIKNKESRKEQILKKIDALYAQGASFGEDLIANGMRCQMDTLLDCYAPYGILNAESDFRGEKTKDQSFIQALNFVFRHFSANPSNTDRTKEITETYIKDGVTSLSLTRYKCANCNGVSEAFWNRIIASLKAFKNQDPNADRDLLFTWIVGYKGCGKTTFINYFMSTKEKQLNEDYKAITIRLNVAYMSSKDDFIDSVKFKICKILFNYYCKESEIARPEQVFFSLDDIEQSTNLSKDEIYKFYNYFTGVSKTKYSSLAMKDFLPLFNNFIAYIKNNHKYSFIIILDNIDQLGISPYEEETYNQRLEQITKLMGEDDLSLGIYVLVMRPKTIYDIQKISRITPQIFSIQTPSLAAIYHSRKEYLSQNKFNGLDNVEQLKKLLDTYVQVVGSSFRKSTQYSELLDLDMALKTIEHFCAENKRLAINLMRLYASNCFKGTLLTDYLSNVLSRNNLQQDLTELLQFGYYRFFEALMLIGGYCCRFNGYDVDPQNERSLIFSNRSEAPNENRFLPNLFKFPSKVCVEAYYAVFVKIRILQYLKNLKITESVSINEIEKVLHSIFKYEKNVVRLACKVLLDGGCIDSYNEDIGRFDVNNERNIYVKITERGRIILQTFPEKINYISICLEDMPIPTKYMISEDDVVTFPINNYYYYIQNDVVCPFIIENILFTSPIIIGFLQELECYEKKIYDEREIKEIPLKAEDFLLIDRLKQNANSSIDKIIDTYLLKSELRISYFNQLPYGLK